MVQKEGRKGEVFRRREGRRRHEGARKPAHHHQGSSSGKRYSTSGSRSYEIAPAGAISYDRDPEVEYRFPDDEP